MTSSNIYSGQVKLDGTRELYDTIAEAAQIYNQSDSSELNWEQITFSTNVPQIGSSITFKSPDGVDLDGFSSGWLPLENGLLIELTDSKVTEIIQSTAVPDSGVNEIDIPVSTGTFNDDDDNPSVTFQVYAKTPFYDMSLRTRRYNPTGSNMTPNMENLTEFIQDLDATQDDWSTIGDEPQRIGPWHTNDNNASLIHETRSNVGSVATFSIRRRSQKADPEFRQDWEKYLYFEVVGTKRKYDVDQNDFVESEYIRTLIINTVAGQEEWKKYELPLKPGHPPMEVNDYTYNDWLNDVYQRIDRDKSGDYSVHRLIGGVAEIKGTEYRFDHGLFIRATTSGSAGNNIPLTTSGHGVLPASTLTGGVDLSVGGPGGATGPAVDGDSFVTYNTNTGEIKGQKIN